MLELYQTRLRRSRREYSAIDLKFQVGSSTVLTNSACDMVFFVLTGLSSPRVCKSRRMIANVVIFYTLVLYCSVQCDRPGW